jgi:alpha-ketoglutarate-dependent taurine dioxygenase
MMFKTSFLNSKKLPLVIEPDGEMTLNLPLETGNSLWAKSRQFLLAELLRYGALLFRGFSIQAPRDFEKFVRDFSGRKLLNYAGGVSPRIELGGGVYSSTEYPAQYTLSLHNELSYSSRYPEQVYFCCVTAPETGGETPIGDSRTILKNIDPKIVREFKAKKIKYERNLQGDPGSGYSWQDAFETSDRAAVENYCRKIGAEFEWKAGGGGLRLSEIRPATALHPATGEEVWFNQADGFHPSNLDAETLSNINEEDLRLNARFGDGTPLDVSMLDHIRAVMQKEMTVFQWREGDVLVLDNMLAAHGRMPFSGARRIVLAMT